MSTVDDSASNRGLGGRIGGKVAAHVANAALSSKVKAAPIQRAVGNQILSDFFAGTGAELRNTMGPIFADLAKHPDTPDNVRPLFHFLSRGKGEMASFIGGSITGSVISGGLGDLLNNALAPVVHSIIGQEPFGELNVSDVAEALARGIPIGRDHADEAARAGYNSDRFNALVQLHYQRPDMSLLLDMLNRGLITDGDTRGALLQLGFRDADLDSIVATRRQLLTPAALADMVVRDIMAESDAAPIAAQSGLSTEDFHSLVLDTGEAPGIQDLLFAHRRGFIDLTRLEHGIKQSRVRTEWTDVIESLSLQPMSTADAVEGAVQGHLTQDQSRVIAAQNGLMPEHWQTLYDNAGNPPGVQEMVSMWHRGVLTQEQLVAGIRESRLKDKYIQPTIDAAATIPPERSIVSLVSKGGLSDAQGMDLLLRRGYPQDIAEALLAEAHVTKTAKQRELTASQIIALYEDGAIAQADVTSMLTALNYDAELISWELALADLRRIKTANDAAVSKVHSLYVGWKITQQDALSTLDSLRIAPGERDNLISLWDVERNINTKQLTLAQITSAHKKGLIDDQGFYERLRGIGYAIDDAVILSELQGIDPTTLNVS